VKVISASVKKNLSALFLLQLGNYLVPLLLLPVLTQRLGPDGYGVYGFALAFGAYFVLLVDWGFNLSATQEISVQRDQQERCQQIYWSTLFAKILLSVVGLLALLALVTLFSELASMRTALLLSFMSAAGAAITPTFYYQGVERMSVMAITNLGVKLLAIPLTLLTVHGEGDELWAIGIQSGTIFLAGLLNFLIFLKNESIGFLLPTKMQVVTCLKRGYSIFLSTAAISLYTNTNIVILKFVSTPAAIGYFYAGQSVVKAVCGLYSPLSQAIFPRMSHLFSQDLTAAGVILRRLLRMQVLFSSLLSIGLLVLSPLIVSLLFGEDFQPSVSVLRWLSPLPLILALSNTFGVQAMIPLGATRSFTKILILCGLASLAITPVLATLMGADGVAISVVVTELGIALAMYGYLMKNHRNLLVSSQGKVHAP